MTDSCNFLFENTTDNHTPTATTPSGTPPCVTPAIYARLKELAAKGHGKSYAARHIGLCRDTISKVPGIDWPRHGHSLEVIAYRKRQQTAEWRAARKKQSIESRPGKRHRVSDGRSLTVREIAEEAGVSRETVRWRLIRGTDLLQKPDPFRAGSSSSPKMWRIDMSRSDWEAVIDYARERTVQAAGAKFGVPQGAINALLRGETWRVVGFDAD